MFDTENDRLGFAESIRALPGSCIVSTGQDCPGPIVPPPEEPESRQSKRAKEILLLLTLVILVVLVACTLVVCYKKRQHKENASVGDQRVSRSKKGYGLQDEKEDDEEEDNLGIDYEKPTLN